MKMSYILLLLFLFSFSNSQYIATSHSHDIVLAYTLQYLQRALNQNLLEKLKEIEISDFTAGTYKVTSVKPVSVLADFKGSLGDMHNNLFIVSPNKLTLNYIFSYVKGDKTIENVQLVFSVFSIKLKLSLKEYQPVFDVTILNRQKGFKVYYAEEGDNPVIEKTFYDVFNKNEEGKEKIIELIAQYMKTLFTDYYKDLYAKKENIKFKISELLGGKEFTSKIKTFMGFCEDPENLMETAICYFDGNVFDEPVQGLKNESLTEEKFKNPLDNYYIFINYKLMFSTFKDTELNLKLTKDTFTDLSFGFKVKDIKHVFNISEQFSDDECTVDGIIFLESIDDTGLLHLSIIHRLNIKDTQNVIEFQSNVLYQIVPNYLSSTSFDLCIENAEVIDLYYKTTDILDERTLKGWIEEVMYNEKRQKICYTNTGFNLKEYYRYIEKVITGEKGIFVEGKHIYF